MGYSFIGRGNWITRRKLPTCRKSLTNFIIQWRICRDFQNGHNFFYWY